MAPPNVCTQFQRVFCGTWEMQGRILCGECYHHAAGTSRHRDQPFPHLEAHGLAIIHTVPATSPPFWTPERFTAIYYWSGGWAARARQWAPSKQETRTQYWVNAGPPTFTQYWMRVSCLLQGDTVTDWHSRCQVMEVHLWWWGIPLPASQSQHPVLVIRSDSPDVLSSRHQSYTAITPATINSQSPPVSVSTLTWFGISVSSPLLPSTSKMGPWL